MGGFPGTPANNDGHPTSAGVLLSALRGRNAIGADREPESAARAV